MPLLPYSLIAADGDWPSADLLNNLINNSKKECEKKRQRKLVLHDGEDLKLGHKMASQPNPSRQYHEVRVSKACMIYIIKKPKSTCIPFIS